MVSFDANKRNLQLISRRLTPSQVESILEQALYGDPTYQAELFELMEDSWPRLAKNLNEVKRAVAALPWQVQPYAEKEGEPSAAAQEKAALVEKALLSFRPDATRWEANFEEAIYHLLDAHAKGISVLELYWTEQGSEKPFSPAPGIIGPRAAKFIPGRYYGFPNGSGVEDRLMLNPEGNGNRGGGLIDFPPDKFLVGICPSRSGHPMNTGLLRSLAKYWIGSQFGFQWLCNYAQMFGAPIRWATYDPNNAKLLDDIVAMLENLGTSGWGAFPMGTTLDLKEPMKAAQDNPQVFLQETADKACDILILGQTLTTDVGSSGSRALGETHNSIRGEVLQASASWAAGIINSQLIPAILRLNYGNAEEAPSLILEIEEKGDELLKAQRDKILFVDMGLPVAQEFLYERHAVPAPKPSDELFEPASQAPEGQGLEDGEEDPEEEKGKVEKMAARRGPALHSAALIEARRIALMDKLTNNIMEGLTGVSQQWLGPAKPIFRELLAKAMDESISDADLIKAMEKARAQMPELFDSLDKEALAKALEEAMGAAAFNGAITASVQRKKGRKAKR